MLDNFLLWTAVLYYQAIWQYLCSLATAWSTIALTTISGCGKNVSGYCQMSFGGQELLLVENH
jgi:hypothetical protein